MTAEDKLYDGNTSTSGTITVSGAEGTDEVFASGSFAFINKHAGEDKTVNVSSITLTGAAAHNYSISADAATTADITKKVLNFSLFTAADKVYDGNAAVNGTGFTDDRIAGDNLVFSYEAAFDNKNVASNKTVSYTNISLSGGTDQLNYTLASQTGTSSASVTAKPLTATATALDKVYDGVMAASGTINLAGSVLGDDVTASGSFAFVDKNVGNTKTVNISAISLLGNDAGNYTVNATATTNASITKRTLTMTAENKSKLYKEPFDPAFTIAWNGFQNNETVAVLGGTYTIFREVGEEAGNYDIWIISSLTSSNYNIVKEDGNTVTDNTYGTFTIEKRVLTVIADSKTKVYGSADPALTYSIDGFVDGETSALVTGALSRSSGNNVAVYEISLNNLSAGNNYTIDYTGASLSITKASLTVTVDAKSKVYGADEPILSYTPSGTLYYTDSYNVITGVNLSTATGAAATTGDHTITISAGTAANYNITHVNGTLSVAKAELTVTADAKSKVYGASEPVLGYTSSGTLYYTDGYNVITGVTLSTATGAAATAGDHTITISGGTADNYNITHVNGTLSVAKAELTVTADAKSKVYGAVEPILGYTPSGTLYYTDGYNVITGVNLSTAIGAAATAGNHTITILGGTAANYNVTHVNGVLNVAKAELTVTADAKSKVYGASEPVLGYTPSGTLYYTDGYNVITGVNLSTATGAAATAGDHTITISEGTAANYNITHVNGNLSVAKAELTVTADAKSKVYGASEPILTYTPSGTLYYTDGYNVITGVTLSTATGAVATTGDHTISISGGTAANYNITHVDSTLSVAKAELTVTADAKSKVYGAVEPVLSYSPSGTLYYTDGYNVITGVTLSTATGAAATAGDHTITISGGTAANYNITHVNGTLSVAKAELTVTADNKSKVYGAVEPILGYTPSGTLYYTDGYNVITGVTLNTDSGAAATAGNHTITILGGTAANYNITHVNGTLSVAKAELTVTADDDSKVYGAVEPVLGYTPSGTLYYTDSYNVITGVTLSTATGAAATAGDHTITILGGTAANYNITHVNGTLSVAKAELTITADNKSKVYGAVEPILTYTPSGTLYYTDGYNVITGVNLSTAIGAAATTGDHTITILGGTASNYNVTHVNGTLSVTKAELTVTADAKSKVYGAVEPILGYTPSGTLYYTDGYNVITGVTLSTATGAAATAGDHSITILGGTAANYNITHVNGTLSVAKAELTVTADNKSKVYGAVEPILGYTPSGTLYYTDSYNVITGVTLNTDSGAAATAGNHTITILGGTAANYNVTHVNGTLSVAKAELTITADDDSKVYGASEPILTYTPSGTLYYTDGYNVITGVTLSTATGAAATAGDHTISISGGTAANYNITHVNGNLSVAKAELTVTADAKSKVYGAVEPILGYTPSGTLYYSDGYNVITGVTLSTATGAAATTGDHTITILGGTAANYNITHVNGTLSVAKAELIVTADNKSKVYGAVEPILGYTPSGTLYYTDGYNVITGVTLSTATGAAATAGDHTITILGGTAANYNVTHVNGTLIVAKAELTVTADAKSKVYGAVEPILGYTPSGTLYYSDGYNVITGVTLNTDSGAAATAGSHTITILGGTASNYNITLVNGTLSVAKAELTVTADNKSKVYGAVEPVLGYTPSGTLYYTDGYNVITGVTLSTATGAAATTGDHTISISSGTTTNYNITHVNGILSVAKAELTVTADNKSKVYGAVEPILTYTPSGTLYYSDGFNVITGVTLSTAIGAAATAGDHTITILGGTAANYNVTHVNGVLSVAKAELTVTADTKSKVYGADEPILGYTPSGTLYYTDGYNVITGVTLSTATGAAATTGDHTISISGGTAANYNVTHVNGTLGVAKANLSATVENYSKVYGEENPSFSVTVVGFVYGETALTAAGYVAPSAGTTATVSTSVGTPAIIITGGSAANYTFNNSDTGTLTITPRLLTIAADYKSKIIGATDPALTYRLKSGQLYAADAISGQLQREAGDDIGAYEIQQGTLTAGSNYQITYVSAKLYIAAVEAEPKPPANTEVIVIINGEEQNSGTETTNTTQGITKTTLVVEQESVNQRIDEILANAQSEENTIEVIVSEEKADQISTILTGDTVKRLEDEEFEFKITTNDIQYIIGASELSIENTAEQLGVDASQLQDIQVNIQINKIDAVKAQEIRENAQLQDYEVLFEPVEFFITAETTNLSGQVSSVNITTFNNYVERIMEIPADVDPTKITTGIVYNTDGTFSHIPTAVFTANGRWFARLNSLTNSVYSVIWNPITVASVENHWSKEIVNDMASRLIIGNPTTFTPDGYITRGEFAEYITKALGLYRTGVAKAGLFNDVTKQNTLADAITIASTYGIIYGYPDGSFRSDALISRTEAMVMYANAMHVAGLIKDVDNKIDSYEDKDLVADWAYADVQKVVSAGIFNGVTPTMIAPLKTFTYAEAATAIQNLLIETLLIDD